jgi:hypothetical protein
MVTIIIKYIYFNLSSIAPTDNISICWQCWQQTAVMVQRTKDQTANVKIIIIFCFVVQNFNNVAFILNNIKILQNYEYLMVLFLMYNI